MFVTRALALQGALSVFACLSLGSVATAEDYRLAPDAEDEGGFELTPWLRLHPFARTTVTYTSNLLREPNSLKQSETFFQGIIGADVVLSGDGRSLSLGYSANALVHFDEHDLNTVQHQVRVAGEMDYDQFNATIDGIGNWGTINTDPRFTDRVPFFAGYTRAEIAWQATDVFGLVVDGAADYRDNSEQTLDPFDALTWWAGGYATFTPDLPAKLRFEVGSHYRQVLYLDDDEVNPDLNFVSVVGGIKATHEVFTARAQVGYEWGWVLKYNDNQDIDAPNGLFVLGEATWQVFQPTSLSVWARHAIGASSVASWQRRSEFGVRIDQELPARLTAFGSASYDLQQPEREPDLRTQAYVVGLTWDVLPPYIDLGAQASYTRASSIAVGYEIFSVAVGATFRY